MALSPRRLLALDVEGKRVRLSWKTRDVPPQTRTAQISLAEFLRRFALHILPRGLVKIRHYGLLANRDRTHRMEQLRQLLHTAEPDKSQEPFVGKCEGVSPCF